MKSPSDRWRLGPLLFLTFHLIVTLHRVSSRIMPIPISSRNTPGQLLRRSSDQGALYKPKPFCPLTGPNASALQLMRKNQELARENAMLKSKLHQVRQDVIPSREFQLTIDALAPGLRSMYEEFAVLLKNDLHKFIESRIDEAASHFSDKLAMLPNPSLRRAVFEVCEHRQRLTPDERAIYRQSSSERIKSKHKEAEELSVIAELSRSRISETRLSEARTLSSSAPQQFQISDAITELHQTTVTRTISVNSEPSSEPVLASTPEKTVSPPIDMAPASKNIRGKTTSTMSSTRGQVVVSDSVTAEPVAAAKVAKKPGRKPAIKANQLSSAGETVSSQASKPMLEPSSSVISLEDELHTIVEKTTAKKATGRGRKPGTKLGARARKADFTPPEEAISDLENQLSKATIENTYRSGKQAAKKTTTRGRKRVVTSPEKAIDDLKDQAEKTATEKVDSVDKEPAEPKRALRTRKPVNYRDSR